MYITVESVLGEPHVTLRLMTYGSQTGTPFAQSKVKEALAEQIETACSELGKLHDAAVVAHFAGDIRSAAGDTERRLSRIDKYIAVNPIPQG